MSGSAKVVRGISAGALRPRAIERAIGSAKIADSTQDQSNSTQTQALFTRESPLIMGRVSSERYRNVIKVGVPKHRLNEFLLLYVRELDNVQVLDENNECNPGDWVLLRRFKESSDPVVAHKVEKVIYPHGNYFDPLTGRRSRGLYHVDDVEKLESIKVNAN